MYDVDATELIEELAKELQKIDTISPPEWASFVKTGASKERPPARQDWWYVRAASVLRKVRVKGPIGVSKLRLFYGGQKNRGHKPEIFKKSSGSILRKILQQLEKSELVKKDKKGVHKGRVITPKGIKLMDNVSKKIMGNKPKEVKPAVVKEVKKENVKPIVPNSSSKAQTKVEEKKAEVKVEKTKEVSQGKKEAKEVPKAEVKKENKVPTAAELAAKKEEKQNG